MCLKCEKNLRKYLLDSVIHEGDTTSVRFDTFLARKSEKMPKGTIISKSLSISERKRGKSGCEMPASSQCLHSGKYVFGILRDTRIT